MQPYFFPYAGHFALISSVDRWIVFDISQYTPKTWMNRNRILHPSRGWQYITVSLSNSSQSIKTFEARVLDLETTKISTAGKISHYKKYAPYFIEVNNLVNNAFKGIKSGSLVNLNIKTLKLVCEYLHIPFAYTKASELGLDYPSDLGPGDWAPYICKMIGAKEYVNPVSGKELFTPSAFHKNGITLLFAEFNSFIYNTDPFCSEPDLSVIDAMMWNSPATIQNALRDNLTLIKAT